MEESKVHQQCSLCLLSLPPSLPLSLFTPPPSLLLSPGTREAPGELVKMQICLKCLVFDVINSFLKLYSVERF